MQIGLFDEGKRLGKLSELGDSLVQLDNVIDWEMFRPILNKVFFKEHKGAGGRPPLRLCNAAQNPCFTEDL